MKVWFRVLTCVVCVSMFATPMARAASNREQQTITKEEQLKAQQTAQMFVKRMQATRDVLQLSDLFLTNFVSHFDSGGESISPSIYLALTESERLRLFAAQINSSYLIALEVINTPSTNYKMESAFDSILSRALARRLRAHLWIEGELRFSSYQDFQTRISAIEKDLADARKYLNKRRIEKDPKFQKQLNDTVTGTGINYRVRAYVGGSQIKDSEPLVGFSPQQKFFRVETPLLIGVVLTEVANEMKIVSVTPVDGD